MTRIAAAVLVLLSAGCAQRASIIVGSKNFTEQLILGELVAQHLEKRLGVRVERKLNLGGTLLTHQALVSGAIDLYPEYTGTALIEVLKSSSRGDAGAVRETVRSEYQRRWGLAWMPPFGFDNTFAMVVRRDDPAANGLATLSEAARRAAPWTLGAGYEFLSRQDGLPGLRQAYGLNFGNVVSMDLGLLYRALEQKQVEMVAANSTDGLLSVLPVRVLEDDRHFFPPYEAAVVVNSRTLARVPGLEKALSELGGRIPAPAMRGLNQQVDGSHRAIPDVARDFLVQHETKR